MRGSVLRASSRGWVGSDANLGQLSTAQTIGNPRLSVRSAHCAGQRGSLVAAASIEWRASIPASVDHALVPPRPACHVWLGAQGLVRRRALAAFELSGVIQSFRRRPCRRSETSLGTSSARSLPQRRCPSSLNCRCHWIRRFQESSQRPPAIGQGVSGGPQIEKRPRGPARER
jgi:hypothetical protein